MTFTLLLIGSIALNVLLIMRIWQDDTPIMGQEPVDAATRGPCPHAPDAWAFSPLAAPPADAAAPVPGFCVECPGPILVAQGKATLVARFARRFGRPPADDQPAAPGRGRRRAADQAGQLGASDGAGRRMEAADSNERRSRRRRSTSCVGGVGKGDRRVEEWTKTVVGEGDEYERRDGGEPSSVGRRMEVGVAVPSEEESERVSSDRLGVVGLEARDAQRPTVARDRRLEE